MSKKLVLKGATLISGRDNEVIEHSRVVLNESIIESVGKADKKDLQERDAEELEVIALDGMTLLPGLIDTHIHLVGNGEISVFVNLFESSMKRAIKSVRYLHDLLSMGITTVRSGGDGNGYFEMALRDSINEGYIEGPRLLATDTILLLRVGMRIFSRPGPMNRIASGCVAMGKTLFARRRVCSSPMAPTQSR